MNRERGAEDRITNSSSKRLVSKLQSQKGSADLKQYAEDERFPCTDPVLAGKIFHKHRVFLTMCFLNRAQGMGWSNTPLYQYFRRQYPVNILLQVTSLD
jgi:hypothetical protein